MTSGILTAPMRDDQVFRLLRNAGAAGLAHEISGEPVRWEDDAQFRLDDLPIDELPWHGVVVSVVDESAEQAVKACTKLNAARFVPR